MFVCPNRTPVYQPDFNIRPPMPFDEANADFLVETMDKILRDELEG
jgi:hypothetical protein